MKFFVPGDFAGIDWGNGFGGTEFINESQAAMVADIANLKLKSRLEGLVIACARCDQYILDSKIFYRQEEKNISSGGISQLSLSTRINNILCGNLCCPEAIVLPGENGTCPECGESDLSGLPDREDD